MTDDVDSGHGDLASLGLSAGERIRFRRPDRARWQEGVVRRRKRDGSIGVVDGDGRSRAIPVEHVEVHGAGPRGAKTWEPLTDRAARGEQLGLLDG